MEIVRENQKRTLKPFSFLTLHEYDMDDPDIGGGLAELSGRYPENGFVTNLSTKELIYIRSGQGKLIMTDKEIPLSDGDMVLIVPGEIYALEGNMSLCMANAPRFDPAQHKQIP